MDNPRPEKVAVVDEVREPPRRRRGRHPHRVPGPDRHRARRRCAACSAPPGVDYKVYKNTLVKLAVAGGPHAEPRVRCSTGPTAIAFVSGEVTAVAKVLRDYARTNPNLVVKGGLLGDGLLDASGADRAGRPAEPRACCWPRSPGPSPPRCSSSPACSRRLPRNLAYGLSGPARRAGWGTGRGGRRAEAHRPRPTHRPRRTPRHPEAPAEAEARTAEAAAEPAGSGAEPRGGGCRGTGAARPSPSRPTAAEPDARRRGLTPEHLSPRPAQPTQPRSNKKEHSEDGQQDLTKEEILDGIARPLRPRALRAPEGLRGALRRDRGRPGRRRAPPRRPAAAARRRRPRRRRRSSTSS